MVEIVGRDEELALLETFLDGSGEGFQALSLEGDAGIGKSTLWRAGVERARQRGLCVLEARPAEVERGFAHTGLGDLFDRVLDDVLPELATPRRRALEIALELADHREQVDPRTLAVAVRNALQVLAAKRPLLVAIDDVQWLDASSAGALAFALRRLREENVLVLLARRVGEDGADLPLDAEPLRVTPLSLGATQRLVQAELGTTFARPTLLRLHSTSGGNPFYALELASALAAHAGGGDATGPLPVPETLEALVRARLEGLPEPTRDALLVAAALGRATPAVLRAAGVHEGALDAATDARVIEVDGTIRFTHPLLASVLYFGAPARERRRAHARLAEAVHDPVVRARHLALATDEPDRETAVALERAAEHASALGAAVAAAELHDHALRLTPADAPEERHRRTLAAAEAHLAAGQAERARTLAEELERVAVAGPRRADALLLLADVESGDLHRSIALRREALEQVAGHPELEAGIEQSLSLYVRFSQGAAAAEEHAQRAVELAERSGDDALRAGALASLALLRFSGGKPDAPGIAEQAYYLASGAGNVARLIDASFCLAHVRLWAMRLDEAREILEPLSREWAERDERVVANASWYLSLVELRAGRWNLADEYAQRARELNTLYSRDETEDPTNVFPPALLAAHRGDLEHARELAARSVELADRQRALLPGLEATIGIIDLWSGDAGAAVASFEAAEPKAAKAGWVEPSMCWWRPDHAEALLELGRNDDARDAVDSLEAIATRLGRPWWLAHATRCRGLLDAAAGDVEAAARLLEEAAAMHDDAGDPFGRARALLSLGVVLRRTRQKRAARDAIEAAAEAFDGLGAAGWAEKARAEQARISGRRRDEGLTPAERRVAALVAEGRTNREVAAALFLGERTVESHLTQVYSKLGVRSRTELASKFRGSHDFKESPAS